MPEPPEAKVDAERIERAVREILIANWTNATEEVAACANLQTKKKLEARQAVLESMIDRVTESCAML